MDIARTEQLTLPVVVVPKGTFTADSIKLPKENSPISMHTNSGKKLTKTP
jgi:hypothetical protein